MLTYIQVSLIIYQKVPFLCFFKTAKLFGASLYLFILVVLPSALCAVRQFRGVGKTKASKVILIFVNKFLVLLIMIKSDYRIELYGLFVFLLECILSMIVFV